VLAYRTISYWLPTVPGVVAYLELRHGGGPSHDDDAVDARATPQTVLSPGSGPAR
jgi:hypothetical protein